MINASAKHHLFDMYEKPFMICPKIGNIIAIKPNRLSVNWNLFSFHLKNEMIKAAKAGLAYPMQSQYSLLVERNMEGSLK